MAGLIDAEETARRVKAARAYAELTREQLAARTSLSVKSLKLIEERRRQSTTRGELMEIAAACEVPEEFMEIGFQGAQQVYADLQRIFAAVLSQDMPSILAEAERLGVLEDFRPGGPGNPDGLVPDAPSQPRSGGRADEPSAPGRPGAGDAGARGAPRQRRRAS